jgi:hypothetical protein
MFFIDTILTEFSRLTVGDDGKFSKFIVGSGKTAVQKRQTKTAYNLK